MLVNPLSKSFVFPRDFDILFLSCVVADLLTAQETNPFADLGANTDTSTSTPDEREPKDDQLESFKDKAGPHRGNPSIMSIASIE